MNLYACTVTFLGEAESADEFGKRLTDSLDGNKDAQAGIRPTTQFEVILLGRVGQERDE